MSSKKEVVVVKATINQLLSKDKAAFDQTFEFTRSKFAHVKTKGSLIELLNSAGATLGKENALIMFLRRSKKHREFVSLETDTDFKALARSLKVKNTVRLIINDSNPITVSKSTNKENASVPSDDTTNPPFVNQEKCSNTRKGPIDFAGLGDAFIEAALEHFKDIMSEFPRNFFEATAPVDGVEGSTPKKPKNNTIHPNVSCDSCSPVNFVPLKGVRYACLVCPDFDLCEECESKGIDLGIHSHSHPMAKIIDPASQFIRPLPGNGCPVNADLYYDIPLKNCTVETKEQIESMLNDEGIQSFFDKATKYIANSERYEELVKLANEGISPDDDMDENLKFVVMKTLIEDALSKRNSVDDGDVNSIKTSETASSSKTTETEENEMTHLEYAEEESEEGDTQMEIVESMDEKVSLDKFDVSEHVVIRPKTFNQNSWIMSVMLVNKSQQIITGGDFTFEFSNESKSFKVNVKNASSIKPYQARYYNLRGFTKGMEDVDNMNIKIGTGAQTLTGVFHKDADSILEIFSQQKESVDEGVSSAVDENVLNDSDIVNVTLVPKSSTLAQVIINNKSSKVIDCSHLKLQVINCFGKSVVDVTIRRKLGILPNKHAKFNVGIINTHMKFPFRLIMKNQHNVGEVELSMNELSGNFKFNAPEVLDVDTSETESMEDITDNLHEDISSSNVSGSTRSIVLPLLPKESSGESMQSSEYIDAENSLSKNIEKDLQVEDPFDEDYDIISVDEEEEESGSEFEMLSPTVSNQ